VFRHRADQQRRDPRHLIRGEHSCAIRALGIASRRQ
jgi:hypothetical protein